MATNVQYHGACRLCDCLYMGSVNNECSCHHPAYQHVPLTACKAQDCDCQEYDDPAAYRSCYNCGHDSDSHGGSPGDQQYNQLRMWVAQGIKQNEMITLYESSFKQPISLRSLQRKLAAYGLSSVDPNVSDEEIMRAARLELECSNGAKGYHSLHRILREKHNLLISSSMNAKDMRQRRIAKKHSSKELKEDSKNYGPNCSTARLLRRICLRIYLKNQLRQSADVFRRIWPVQSREQLNGSMKGKGEWLVQALELSAREGDRLYALIRQDETFPRGKDPKAKKKLHQKPFCSEGPNWLWSADGHEKLAQPFGLYIYGITDTFSRKVLSLKVLPNKRAQTVSSWLVDEINNIKGVPGKIMIDKGSEWNEVVPNAEIVQMQSKFNQKIEAFWRRFTKESDENCFRVVLKGLEGANMFRRGNEKDKWAVWMAFGVPLQHSLNQFRDCYNSHKIRYQKNVDMPTGKSPNVMYSHPELFNTEDFLTPTDPINVATVDECRKYVLPADIFDRCLTATKETSVQLYHDIKRYID